jgi:hypothetical protein
VIQQDLPVAIDPRVSFEATGVVSGDANPNDRRIPGSREQKLDGKRLRQARGTRYHTAAGGNQTREPFDWNYDEGRRKRSEWKAGAQSSTKNAERQQPQPRANGREQENNSHYQPLI